MMFSLVCCVILLWHLVFSNDVYAFTTSSSNSFPKRFVPFYQKGKQASSEQIMDANTTESTVNLMIDEKALANLAFCDTETCARKVLNEALTLRSASTAKATIDTTIITTSTSSAIPLFNSVQIPPGATDRPISDADLALQTGIRGTKFKVTELIETSGDRDVDRASIFLLCLMVATSASAIVVNQFQGIPEIIRFLLVWVLSFTPLGFVGAGLALPQDLVQGPLISWQRWLFPSFRRRMVQHEAGHFLVAYLLGKPIRAYRASNAVKNAVEFYPLADEDIGVEKARLLGFDKRRNSSSADDTVSYEVEVNDDRPYFSKDGQGGNLLRQQSVFRHKEELKDDTNTLAYKSPKLAWPYRGLDHKTLDELAVISLGGVCAEIIGFGNAEGGVADLNQLRQLFSYAVEPTLTEKQIENRVRFAIGYGTTLLRRNLLALDSLAQVMERDGTIEECVVAIETSTQHKNTISVEANYEQRRKELLQGSNAIERLFLSAGRKSADILEDRTEGKGGGERQPRLFMSPVNDDPLIAALAIAATFYLWAISGGLSLH